MKPGALDDHVPSSAVEAVALLAELGAGPTVLAAVTIPNQPLDPARSPRRPPRTRS